MKRIALATLACGLALTQGCMVCVYGRPNGPKVFIAGVLVNDTMKKLALDHMTKTTSMGMSADGVNVQVDNAGLEAVTKGVTDGVLKGLGVP